jgi:ATP-binding cassette, subfamily C (CFTR/MRP), member 1
MASLRAALVTLIYSNMLTLHADYENSSAAVSLMSTDIDRINATVQSSLVLIPNLIQLVFAMWILATQLGAASVAPVITALGASYPPMHSVRRPDKPNT